MKIKQGIPIDKRNECITFAYQYFEEHINVELFVEIIQQETNWELSAMLIDDNKIYGLYLLGNKQIHHFIKDVDKKYKLLNGIEGVLLAIDDSIRNQGWGNKLKDFPKTYRWLDYIWGQQLKSLNNLDDWLKRRELIAITDDCYITLELFKK